VIPKVVYTFLKNFPENGDIALESVKQECKDVLFSYKNTDFG